MKPALLITIITILAGTVRLPAADTPPPADQTIPLGVYWAGEMVGSAYDNNPVKRKAELEKRFADLAAHNVTAIWLTHTDAKEGAEMARMAGKHGIRLVASLGPLAMEVGGIPDEEHAKATRKMLVEDWGDAPAPFAWGIGDEPSTTYMEEVAKASANIKRAIPTARTTAVMMPMDYIAAAKMVNFDWFTVDIYPFFSANNPNGPGDHGSSTMYYMQACQRAQNWALKTKARGWWVMPQIYQEPWGPWDYDDQGNIVHLPGGGPHWRMPTPAEVKWQTWAGIAGGARGVFYFIYYWPGRNQPNAEPIKDPALGFVVKEKVNTGAPRGIVYPDGRSTPAYEAMGQAFGEIKKLTPLVLSLKPATEEHAYFWGGWPWPGDMLTCWDGPDGKKYAILVNGNTDKRQKLKFTLAKPFLTVRDLRTGQTLKPVNDEPYMDIEAELAPGEGTVLELLAGQEAFAAAVEPIPTDPQRAVYTEDFSDPERWKKDAKEVTNVTLFNSEGRGLSASSAGLRANRAYVIYDLYRLVGQTPANTYRLTYTGTRVGPDGMRGVHVWTSDNGFVWKKVSMSEFNKPLAITGRYVRLGMMYIQASDFHYGNLISFKVERVNE